MVNIEKKQRAAIFLEVMNEPVGARLVKVVGGAYTYVRNQRLVWLALWRLLFLISTRLQSLHLNLIVRLLLIRAVKLFLRKLGFSLAALSNLLPLLHFIHKTFISLRRKGRKIRFFFIVGTVLIMRIRIFPLEKFKTLFFLDHFSENPGVFNSNVLG